MSYEQLMSSRSIKEKTETILAEEQHSYKKELRKSFGEEASVIFNNHAELKHFSWTQATDRYLDYEFFSDKHDVVVNGMSFAELKNEPIYQAYKDIAEFLEEFEENELLSLFGDHVLVKVTSHGIDVSFFDVDV